MLDDFTAEYRGGAAPVDAARDRIDHLEALGVNAVELMPWTAWPSGSFSWGYSPFALFAVEDRYLAEAGGDPLSRLFHLKRLVTELRRRGIHVVMDGVFNHVRIRAGVPTAPRTRPRLRLPLAVPGPGPVAVHRRVRRRLLRRPRLQQPLHRPADLRRLRFWLDEYQLDGITLDYTLGFHRPGDTGRGRWSGTCEPVSPGPAATTSP